MLGMAQKAGKLASGEFSVEKAVKARRARLVVVAADASEKTRKKFRDMCSFYHTPMVVYSSREELGGAIGKEFRASIGVLDENFARAVSKQIDAVSATE